MVNPSKCSKAWRANTRTMRMCALPLPQFYGRRAIVEKPKASGQLPVASIDATPTLTGYSMYVAGLHL